MYKEIIFSGNTVNQVAERFASIVSQNYLEALRLWKITAIEETEAQYWKQRMQIEPEIVKKNTYQKILKIMKETNNPYIRQTGLFKNSNVISITRASGFFNDLLNGKDIKYSVKPNEEYLINKKALTIEKRVHPDYKRL